MTQLLKLFSYPLTKTSSIEFCLNSLRNSRSHNLRTIKTVRNPIQSLASSNYAPRKFRNVYIKNGLRFYSGKMNKDEVNESKNIWKSVLIVLFAGGMCTAYMLYLKNQKLLILEKERKRALGKAAIGGKFELVDHDNQPKKSEDFYGKWLLIYFGFTHCPDICPDEMEKMVEVINLVDKSNDLPNVLPIFITVDPARDTTSVVKKYVKEFSDKFIGLTGTVDQIANVCKAYRVYFSAGPKDKDSDYIVDHSIIMYLIDPQGEFMDYFGQNKTASQIVDGIRLNVIKYNQMNRKGFFSNIF